VSSSFEVELEIDDQDTMLCSKVEVEVVEPLQLSILMRVGTGKGRLILLVLPRQL
jgi:hypothetical protein